MNFIKNINMNTLQEMWLEFLWCRERLQWKSGMPRIGVGDAEIKINEKGQKILFGSISSNLSVWSLKLGLENAKICPLFTSQTQIKKSFVCFALQIAPF